MATPRRREKGIAIVTMTISLVAIVGISGLAIDMSNHYLTKTLIQNALDASALSGAKVLNDLGDPVQAENAAQTAFNFHLSGKLQGKTIIPTYEFSDTLDPFVDGGVDPKYIRVSVPNFNVEYFLAQVLPGLGETQNITGTAVAGPSPPLGTGNGNEICGIAPLLICAGNNDGDCSDGSCWGYDVEGEVPIVMKTGSGSGWEVGSGNFQLLELGCGTGGNCVRRELAGEFDSCLTIGDTATTEPGNTVGPVNDGFNSRFGNYQGSGQINIVDHPPDTITYSDPTYNPNAKDFNPQTTQNNFWYQDYKLRQANGPYDYIPLSNGGQGVPGRRILNVPVGSCTGTTNGRGEVEIYGAACMFMFHPATHKGDTQYLFGQFIGQCEGDGDIPENPPGPGAGFGIYKIILYKDPDSVAS